jgi:hypothetical protein
LSENDEYEEQEPEYEEEAEEEGEEEESEYEEEGEEEEEPRPVMSFTTYDDGSYSVTRYDYEGESQCFVATACYGSALDEHVVFLRRFRDSEVMRTSIGRGFMRMFNAVYYSFSPSLASYLRCHLGAKLVVRYVVVAPIIHLLRLSRCLTRPMSKMSREASTAATGLVFVLTWFIIGWTLLYLISSFWGLRDCLLYGVALLVGLRAEL